MSRPKARPAPGTVLRFFVCNARGEVWDGPFRTHADVERSVEKYRNSFGQEPVVRSESIQPIGETDSMSASYSILR